MIQPKHGGKRSGAGRKKGIPNANSKPDKSVSKTVSMPESAWVKLDNRRGSESRGKYIAGLLGD